MLVFISGGVKCGKSMFAQHISRFLAERDNGGLVYGATMMPMDDEDRKRISRHVEDRSGWGFRTIEEGLSLAKLADQLFGGETVLFDSLTAYVQNNMFFEGDYHPEFDASSFKEDLQYLCGKCANLVVVSDYIFSDAIVYEDLTERYRMLLGKVQCECASAAQLVAECSYSNIKIWKNDSRLDIGRIKEMFYSVNSYLTYGDI